MTNIILASRRSLLALQQTDTVAEAIRRHFAEVTVSVVSLSTRGDEVQDRPLADVGGKELFIHGLRQAITSGRATAAVHSLKDMAALPSADFSLAAVGFAEDRRDVVINLDGNTLQQLPVNATVGTSSPRRIALLKKHYPDLKTVPLRGNIHSRLEKLRRGDCAAIILAAAGLKRMGLENHITDYLAAEQFIPAVGQGVLAVECAAKQTATIQQLAQLTDAPMHRRITAERTFAAAMHGDCHTPLGAHAVITDNDEIALHAFYATTAGDYHETRVVAAAPVAAGEQAAADILCRING